MNSVQCIILLLSQTRAVVTVAVASCLCCWCADVAAVPRVALAGVAASPTLCLKCC